MFRECSPAKENYLFALELVARKGLAGPTAQDALDAYVNRPFAWRGSIIRFWLAFGK